jgi:hypothetical protein
MSRMTDTRRAWASRGTCKRKPRLMASRTKGSRIACKSAGVMFVLEPGDHGPPTLVLARHRDKPVVLSDFGGKRELGDASRWETALRECTEECGRAPSAANVHQTVVLSNKLGNEYMVFVATLPRAALTGLRAGSWETCTVDSLKARPEWLHPRLRFASGITLSALVEACERVGRPRPPPLTFANGDEDCELTSN